MSDLARVDKIFTEAVELYINSLSNFIHTIHSSEFTHENISNYDEYINRFLYEFSMTNDDLDRNIDLFIPKYNLHERHITDLGVATMKVNLDHSKGIYNNNSKAIMDEFDYYFDAYRRCNVVRNKDDRERVIEEKIKMELYEREKRYFKYKLNTHLNHFMTDLRILKNRLDVNRENLNVRSGPAPNYHM